MPVHAFELHREAQWSLTRLHTSEDSRYDHEAAQLFVRCLEDHSGFTEAYGRRIKRGLASADLCSSFESIRQRCESDEFDWTALGGRPARRPYIVLELLPGGALHLALQSPPPQHNDKDEAATAAADSGAPLSLQERRSVLLQLARACEYLAAFGLVHRDLRACNVQLCQRAPSVIVKVLDLGVAIAAKTHLRATANPAIRVFQAVSLTPDAGYDWLPPEVRAAEVNGAGSQAVNFEWPHFSFDAYSLGVLWLELFLGKLEARKALKRVVAGAPFNEMVASFPGGRLGETHASLEAESIAVRTLQSLLGLAAKRPQPCKVRLVLANIFNSAQSPSTASDDALSKKRTLTGNVKNGASHPQPNGSVGKSVSGQDVDLHGTSEKKMRRSSGSHDRKGTPLRRCFAIDLVTAQSSQAHATDKDSSSPRTPMPVSKAPRLSRRASSSQSGSKVGVGVQNAEVQLKELAAAEAALQRMAAELTASIRTASDAYTKSTLQRKASELLQAVEHCRNEAAALLRNRRGVD
eukprot:TRINITY_DN6080_c0_g2_i1.p1 TRINITY_DN6080_c0_g2~~TRINITY_DN6080_c0_g2_i1.p1  ORF type:complete len:612 (-),score=78.00 TRINITY_DN6080_c0_g2_i1:362-1927(-)